MRVRTHLLAMPWAPPDAPSIQIAALKAHLDRALGRRGACRSYPAFFSILDRLAGPAFLDAHQELARYGECLYQLLYHRRFGPPALRGRSGVRGLLSALRQPATPRLRAATLDRLEQATCRYLDAEVGPALLLRGLNLVGFTLNYDQVYASLYATRYLRQRFPAHHLLFAFGGRSPCFPDVYRLLCRLGVRGLVVMGEGEQKLERLVALLQGLPGGGAEDALAAVDGLDPGVVVIGRPVDLSGADPARLTGQVELETLALPDYGEYFAALRRARGGPPFAERRAGTEVLVEGSRGCFGRCDFCAMHRSWRGFRTRRGGEVLGDALTLAGRYRTARVQFTDNVCDTWAEDYARGLVEGGIRLTSCMELRAHHPEEFFSLLALGGLETAQIGVEAISASLLQAMGKGTTVAQNLLAQKVFTELGVATGNNLITHHPASTVADVRETWRILRQIPHWQPFRMTRFRLMAGSPLHQRLSPEERAGLRPALDFPLRGPAARYACPYAYRLPPTLHPGRPVMRAWSALARRYQRAAGRQVLASPRLEVARLAPDLLRLTDTRRGTLRVTSLAGEAARVYDSCHGAPTVEAIGRAAGLSPARVQAVLRPLLRRELVLRLGDRYLALATRPRDELLSRLGPALRAGGARDGARRASYLLFDASMPQAAIRSCPPE